MGGFTNQDLAKRTNQSRQDARNHFGALALDAVETGFQEKTMGSITPGKYADFVILDRDIMSVPVTDILKTNVISTWIGGKPVYERR